MADIVSVIAALKALVPESAIGIPIFWHGDDIHTLPNTPSPFVFAVFNNEGANGVTAFGGGRGRNIFRNRALLEAYVFSPLIDGLEAVLARAEIVAALLRSYRDDTLSCGAASVLHVGPGSTISVPGLSSGVSQYQCAVVEVDIVFDQLG